MNKNCNSKTHLNRNCKLNCIHIMSIELDLFQKRNKYSVMQIIKVIMTKAQEKLIKNNFSNICKQCEGVTNVIFFAFI